MLSYLKRLSHCSPVGSGRERAASPPLALVTITLDNIHRKQEEPFRAGGQNGGALFNELVADFVEQKSLPLLAVSLGILFCDAPQSLPSELRAQHRGSAGELSLSGTGSSLWLAIDSEIKVFLCSALLIHCFCFHVFHFLSGSRNASSLTSFHVQNFSLFPSTPFFPDLWSRPDPGLQGFCCP